MIASVTDLVPGEFVHSLGDTHIYLNHLEQVEEQLSRDPHRLPKIEINKKTAQVTEKIISSNEIMMEAVEDSKKVNEELVEFLETSLKEQKKNNLQKVYEVIKTMASKPSGLIGLSILLFHVILAITSPLYVPYDYKAIDPSLMLQAPSSEYWFGTDSLGRDVFTRTILGGRTALTVTFFVT